MERLNFKREQIDLEVNDNGDYITLNFNDKSFAPRFLEMTKEFEKDFEEAKAKIEEALKNEETEIIGDDIEIPKGHIDYLNIDLELHKGYIGKIDGLFGENTCKKVFGEIVPSTEAITEFFQALAPYFLNHAKKQSDKLSKKYNPGRKGNV